jgi:hypothetical protein
MQKLAALMLSMTVLTTAVFMHALTTHRQSPAQTAPLARGVADDHWRQLAAIRNR